MMAVMVDSGLCSGGRKKRPALAMVVLDDGCEGTRGGVRLQMEAEDRESYPTRVITGKMKETAQQWAQLRFCQMRKAVTHGGSPSVAHDSNEWHDGAQGRWRRIAAWPIRALPD
ncbi:hypothetical protein L1987_64480 [Smallanthus sonchifolius]|uniref:Uncharacterized protein n=1 Tax=Smallanthus sonchifolius TaxID=185202 RepID=A0ACB9CG88_9ASTR|nr:hypothetical protein L1987_64480 [Smallanthus sonchifolius]